MFSFRKWLNGLIALLVLYQVIAGETVPEVIRKKGYACEIHHVTTKDGYILTLHRIPPKRYHVGSKYHWNSVISNRPPVVMQHGLLSSSGAWTLDLPHDAPAFIIADAGYDVWLSNIRGNYYSKNHTHLSIRSKEYWQFSWDEMAKYDFPAIIDYVLDRTNFKQLFYVGHSMGTTIYFAGMTFNPSYNKKIRGMFALGPVGTVEYIKTSIRPLAYIRRLIVSFLEGIGHYEIMPKDSLVIKSLYALCNLTEFDLIICKNLLFMIVGFDSKEFNKDWLPTVEDQLSSGTSVYTLVHYAQEYVSRKFEQYDYGEIKNKEKYGQITPPPYDVSKVISPVHLIWAQNDYLADEKDVNFLIKNLPNVVYKSVVKYPRFNHMDFLWAPHAKKFVYEPMLEMMQKLNRKYV